MQKKEKSLTLSFDDNRLLPGLFGEHNAHLSRIEQRLPVTLHQRGHEVTISGPQAAIDSARATLDTLWARMKQDLPVGPAEVDAALRMATQIMGSGARQAAMQAVATSQKSASTRERKVSPRSPGQARFLEAMAKHELTFCFGPAGTGKTYLAVAVAVSQMQAGEVQRIIISRPAVEAGEKLGFLPGDLREKVDPYLRPIYDALYELMPSDQVVRKLESGDIEVAPLAYMRGRTLKNAFVIVDEAQNTTPMQMKMLLTRLGEGSRMVVVGDITQTDLPNGTESGLVDAMQILEKVPDIAKVELDAKDVVRHPLVAKIVDAYAAAEPGHRV